MPREDTMDSRIDRNRIGDLLEIHRLKGLYFYNLDNKIWDAWGALFTKDARLLVDHQDKDGKKTTDVFDTAEKLLKHTSTVLKTANSVHHGHTPLIEFESETTARGVWAMADIVDFGSDGVLYGYGHY